MFHLSKYKVFSMFSECLSHCSPSYSGTLEWIYTVDHSCENTFKFVLFLCVYTYQMFCLRYWAVTWFCCSLPYLCNAWEKGIRYNQSRSLYQNGIHQLSWTMPKVPQGNSFSISIRQETAALAEETAQVTAKTKAAEDLEKWRDGLGE